MQSIDGYLLDPRLAPIKVTLVLPEVPAFNLSALDIRPTSYDTLSEPDPTAPPDVINTARLLGSAAVALHDMAVSDSQSAASAAVPMILPRWQNLV